MKKKLLVVDDSIFIWEELKMLLSDTDFEVVGCASSGEEALEMYIKLQPDIVTMDIILPGIDGIEAAKIILKNWPAAKIVMISSLAYDETIDIAADIGSRGFICKPFEQAEVLTVLNAALA